MEGTGYTDAAQRRYELALGFLKHHVPPPARLVELGAAPGAQSIAFRHAGYDVTAVDIGEQSDAWEGVDEGTMAERFRAEGVALVLWNLEEVPYPLEDGSADAVVMTEVIEHLRDYPASSLTEIRRILAPGGYLYLTTPNAAYIGNRLRLAFGRSVATPLRDWIAGIPFARHAREYTVSEIRELVDYAQLDCMLVTGRHPYVTSGRTSPLAKIAKQAIDSMARMRPSLGPHLIVLARKPSNA